MKELRFLFPYLKITDKNELGGFVSVAYIKEVLFLKIMLIET